METNPQIALKEILIPLTIVLFIIALGVVLLYQQYQKRLYVQKLDKEALKSAHQQELLKHAVLIQEQERKNIAADLHDELGAALSIIRMNLVMMDEKDFPNRGNLVQLTETAIAATRNISHQLMPPQLVAFGLIKTLEPFINTVNNANKIKIDFEVSSLPDLSWLASLGLYRIIIELINNSVKHAGASNIWLKLYCKDGNLQCRFSDDGHGLPPPQFMNGGLGLRNIEARVSAMEGRLDFGNSEAGGFSASIQIPLKETNLYV